MTGPKAVCFHAGARPLSHFPFVLRNQTSSLQRSRIARVRAPPNDPLPNPVPSLPIPGTSRQAPSSGRPAPKASVNPTLITLISLSPLNSLVGKGFFFFHTPNVRYQFWQEDDGILTRTALSIDNVLIFCCRGGVLDAPLCQQSSVYCSVGGRSYPPSPAKSTLSTGTVVSTPAALLARTRGCSSRGAPRWMCVCVCVCVLVPLLLMRLAVDGDLGPFGSGNGRLA
jgi:hypothetical protein